MERTIITMRQLVSELVADLVDAGCFVLHLPRRASPTRCGRATGARFDAAASMPLRED